jgi:NTE family protein
MMETRKLLAMILVILIPWSAHAQGEVAPQREGEATRPKVAVILSGGAARGAAHVGALQALIAGGVPIDMLIGSSMGSLIAGLYAAGFDAATLAEVVAAIDASSAAELQFPPRGGFLDGTPLAMLIDALVEGVGVYETPTPFYPVVTELFSSVGMLTPPTSLATAVRASTAIPVLFEPVWIDGRYFYDGAMRLSIPSSLAREVGADYVIAVSADRDIPYDPGNFQANLTRIYSGMLVTINAEEKLGTDVTFDAELRQFSYMDFDLAGEFIRAGAAAAQLALPGIFADLEARGIERTDGSDPNLGHPVNQGWRERLVAARAAIRVRERPWHLGFDLALAPRAVGERVTPTPVPVGSRARLGVDLRDGPLGPGSIGVSYARSIEGGSDALELRAGLRLGADADAFARVGIEFEGVNTFSFGVRYRPSTNWTVELAARMPTSALDAAVRLRGTGLWLDLDGTLAADGWWRTHATARGALALGSSGLVLRGHLLAGTSAEATPVEERFSVGPATLLRGLAPDSWVSPWVASGGVELALQFATSQQILDVMRVLPWAWVFVDGALFEAEGEASQSFTAGVGVGVDANLFGFLPFAAGLDVGYGITTGDWRVDLRFGPNYPEAQRR